MDLNVIIVVLIHAKFGTLYVTSVRSNTYINVEIKKNSLVSHVGYRLFLSLTNFSVVPRNMYQTS